MKKVIVTTTINPPSVALLKFAERKDWECIIVGDIKTPHELYKKLEKQHSNVHYLSPQEQEQKYKKLSEVIGWNSIQRRNIGFIEAYNLGADVVATVDDDNIPYPQWGENLLVGREITTDLYEPKAKVFDPLSVTEHNFLWHRGYPIQLLAERQAFVYKGKIKRTVLVQADLWDGDPDIDAMARLTFKPIVRFDRTNFSFCANKIGPFNSQNTFLARKVLPHYAVIPHIGRMDDIWGGYILQYYFPDSVVYNRASVYQERNVQDLVTNLEKEIIGYRYTMELIDNLSAYDTYLPDKAREFYRLYKKEFTKRQ